MSTFSSMRSVIVIVAEGDDAGNSLEIMNKVRPFLIGYDLRHSVLGHIQRGGSPSYRDRMLATQMGSYSVDLLRIGLSNITIGIKGDSLVTINITDSIKEHSSPNMSHLDLLGRLRSI